MVSSMVSFGLPFIGWSIKDPAVQQQSPIIPKSLWTPILFIMICTFWLLVLVAGDRVKRGVKVKGHFKFLSGVPTRISCLLQFSAWCSGPAHMAPQQYIKPATSCRQCKFWPWLTTALYVDTVGRCRMVQGGKVDADKKRESGSASW